MLTYNSPLFNKSKTLNNQTIFYLARHGQTEWNIEQRIQGQLDSPLTNKGQAQALHLADLCLPLNVTRILTSSLGRAVQTAEICAQQLQVQYRVLKGIEERNFGLWQGKLTPDMHNHANYAEITSQVTDCKPESGESALQLLTRVVRAIKEQASTSPDEVYLIITHGDVLRCFMTQFLKSDQQTTGYDYKNGELISISYDHKNKCFLQI